MDCHYMALPIYLVQKPLLSAEVAAAFIKMPAPKMTQDSLMFVILFIMPTIRFTDIPKTLKAHFWLLGCPNVLLCYLESLFLLQWWPLLLSRGIFHSYVSI
jgi:hypothetical protein